MAVNILLGLPVLALFALTNRSIRTLSLRALIFIAIMAALASAGRMLSTAFPSGVQPASAIVIICGMIYGSGGGLLCGVVTAMLSSLLTSVGPWTMWQTLLWSLMGITGAMVSKLLGTGRKSDIILALIGGLWGFIFGWVMNLWYYTVGILPFTLPFYIAACVNSFIFDLAHALSNFIILLFFGRRLTELIKRLDTGRRGKTN